MTTVFSYLFPAEFDIFVDKLSTFGNTSYRTAMDNLDQLAEGLKIPATKAGAIDPPASQMTPEQYSELMRNYD